MRDFHYEAPHLLFEPSSHADLPSKAAIVKLG